MAPVLWISIAWFGLVAWLILRAVRQRGFLRPLAIVSRPAREHAPRVTVIVPARDEESNIGPCLHSLIMQDYPAEQLEMLVVDDESADATFAVASAVAKTDARVRVLRGPPLPPHWLGKSHVCSIGAAAASADAQWLCFLDADVRAKPALIASAVAAAAAAEIDLLSLAPHQELKTFAERLILPCGLCLLAFFQDLRRVQARHGNDATATGQFMLVRRSRYEAVGGHAAVRAAICEDVALARRIKQAGGHVVLLDGTRVVSTRMYTGWGTLWPGFAKNLVDMLGGSSSTLRVAAIAVVLAWAAWLVPLMAADSCSRGTGCIALAPALAGSGAAFGLHVAGALYFDVPFWYGLLFPLGYTAGALMAIDSVWRRWRGMVTWKGRVCS